MPNFDRAAYEDRKSKVQAAKNAMAVCDTIIAQVEGSSAAQTQTAVKRLAQHQKALIRIVAGEVI